MTVLLALLEPVLFLGISDFRILLVSLVPSLVDARTADIAGHLHEEVNVMSVGQCTLLREYVGSTRVF